jgi:hypothetical protein
MIARVFFFFFLLATIAAKAQPIISSDNRFPRTTMNGNIVDAHDGRIIQFGKKFYWYGTAYGNTNGFTNANDYVCYSSTNLKNWQFEGKLLPQKPTGVYYRPHVVFNSQTKKYVLWYNWYPKLWNGQFGVATSNSPTGPFAIVNDSVQVKHQALGVGDLGVFVDDDNKAYLSYNTISGHKVSVEALDDEYTASTLQGSEFIAEHCEAGSMFKRNGLYYLLTDYTCCFCTQGSGAKVFTATTPLGPYTYRQNINRYPGALATGLSIDNTNNNWFEILTAKQENAIEIWLKKPQVIQQLSLQQFTGNRNGQCGEVNNPILHEPIVSYVFKLEYFEDGEWKTLAHKMESQKTALQQQYRFAFAATNAERLRISPKYKDSLSSLQIAAISLNRPANEYLVFKTSQHGEDKPIIPAQQTFVMPVQSTKGTQYIWMGDFWGSATDGVKGHDFQFWSAPLSFYKNGLIRSLQWNDQWSLSIK